MKSHRKLIGAFLASLLLCFLASCGEAPRPTEHMCPQCGGTGEAEILCEACNGNGTRTCETCLGDGVTLCSLCHGEGTVGEDGADCPLCGGACSINCDVCDGAGTVTCDACGGDGVFHEQCDMCGASGTVGNAVVR